ncbi:MAG: sugar phosphate isomerase/epimerase family protein [Anaerolineae bacterium]
MDTTRLSACSIPLIGLPPQRAMTLIAQAGFRKVDLLGRMPHLSLDPGECEPETLRKAAAAAGVRIANLGTYVGAGLADEDQAAQERELAQVRRAVDVAVALGARSIRVKPGNDDPASIDRMAPGFQQAAAYAAAQGVYLGFENHGGAISGDPERCAELAGQVGSAYFGVLYEPCNLAAAGADYRAAFDVLKDHIVHVHLKDGVRTAQGFTHCMLGEGEIDMRWVLERLEEIGYRGDIALEYEMSDPPPAFALGQWFKYAAAL